MPLERFDVEHPLWRKKVDGSLLRHAETPIPGWVAQMWSIESHFPRVRSRRHPDSRVKLRFKNKWFDGAVTRHREKRETQGYRLSFDKTLAHALSESFIMTNMRELEGRLRAAAGDKSDIERDIPFWEFLDIEFDNTNKKPRNFYLTAYYTQQPSFPAIFRRLIGSPPLKRIHDELGGKADSAIDKHNWKPRAEYEMEVGAKNVIYMLVDTKKRLFYVGQAEDLIARLDQGHEPIPGWNYYRYDALPVVLRPYRAQIERMVICDLDSVLGDSARGLPVPMSEFRLVNTRIDRR